MRDKMRETNETLREGALAGKNARIKLNFSAGMLVRREFEKKIRSFCESNGIELSIQENRGFLKSEFILTADGAAEDVERFARFFQERGQSA